MQVVSFIFLINFSFVDEPISVLIPYMVLQELDKLKLQKEKAVSFLATRAIRYINNKFKEGHAKIQGKGNLKWQFLLKRWPHGR